MKIFSEFLHIFKSKLNNENLKEVFEVTVKNGMKNTGTVEQVNFINKFIENANSVTTNTKPYVDLELYNNLPSDIVSFDKYLGSI